MTDKEEIIIDGKTIECPCYIDRPLHRYDKGCLIQSQAFKEQQTKEKPILRCDEIKNCPIKENFKRLKRKEQECEELKKANVLIDNNRKCKAIKLMEIEKLIISCMSGYTDKFIQEIMDIISKPEPVCFENKYEQALDEIEMIVQQQFCENCEKYPAVIFDKNENVCESCEYSDILDIINKAKDGE